MGQKTRRISESLSGLLEYRVSFLHGQPIQILPYWDEGRCYAGLPDMAPFTEAARRIRSPFFTMDIAKTRDGGWTIMELGDGQVPGLPENADPYEFYRRLSALS